MASLVDRHVRDVSGTLSCGPHITNLLLVRVDEWCGSRVQEFLVVLCGENIHPLLVSDVCRGCHATSVSETDSYGPGLTVAHQVLNTGVDEQPDTFIDQRHHEQGCLPHGVAREEEVPVDVHVAALKLDVLRRAESFTGIQKSAYRGGYRTKNRGLTKPDVRRVHVLLYPSHLSVTEPIAQTLSITIAQNLKTRLTVRRHPRSGHMVDECRTC